MKDGDYQYKPSRVEQDPPAHYYGDTVRALFLTGAVVLLVTAGVYRNSFDMPIFLPFLGVILLVLFAGFTMYRQAVTMILNIVIAIASSVFFEYLVLYGNHGRDTLLFWIYQALAINFLFALYFAVKTFRNSLLK